MTEIVLIFTEIEKKVEWIVSDVLDVLDVVSDR